MGTSVINANDVFTYVTIPVVATVSPSSSYSPSQIITISGNNFVGVTGIRFININNPSSIVNATSYTVNNTGQITVVAPGSLGIDVVYDIEITNGQGSSNTGINDRYSYVTDYNQYYSGF